MHASRTETVPQKQVSAAVREQTRERLEDEFRNFLSDATTAEMFFMIDVLQTRESAFTGPDGNELAIAAACDAQIRKVWNTWIQVDEEHRDALSDFLADLEKIGKKPFIPARGGWYLWKRPEASEAKA